LPPKMAPIQVVIVPIWRKNKEKEDVLAMAQKTFEELKKAGVRVKLDERDHLTPGFKFNDWEMKGVPIRIEIGPRDVKKNAVVISRRHKPGKEGKEFGVPAENLAERIGDFLQEVHDGLYTQALNFREENTHSGIEDYETFKRVAEEKSGFLKVYWAGDNAQEEAIKNDNKFTIRCYPNAVQDGEEGRCFYTGKKTKRVAIFARAY